MAKAKRQKNIGINDADYVVKQTIKNADGSVTRTQCPYHAKWASMIDRVYNPNKEVTRHQTYLGVTVCSEWLTFSKFKAWMELQDWQGNFLDKDLLSPEGPGVYSPETCVFISPRLNRLLARGFYPRKIPMPVGVEFRRTGGRDCTGTFAVNIQVCGTKRYVGCYPDISSAVLSYTLSKIKQLNKEKELSSDVRVKEALDQYIIRYAKDSRQEAKMWQEYMDSQTH